MIFFLGFYKERESFCTYLALHLLVIAHAGVTKNPDHQIIFIINMRQVLALKYRVIIKELQVNN